MFRMWCKMWKSGRLIKDKTVCNAEPVNRTRKIFDGIDEVCREWDLAKPIWLQANIRDFQTHSRTRFNQDCFAETIPFDFLEIHVIEED
ncbi:MAG: hypothetical protein IKI01_02675 [Lachnospiraceae bacterium]|nr:hypothetical protein [Lachnospiraceae bacterium]MBR6999500.1 hypothetical protein [Lachnospiraceae bacterium]